MASECDDDDDKKKIKLKANVKSNVIPNTMMMS